MSCKIEKMSVKYQKTKTLCHDMSINLRGFKMKTKSIRAKVDDAKIIENLSRTLAVELQRNVTVSEIIHELMEDIENAEKRIKDKNGATS